MRYLIAVQAQAYITRTVLVEASTAKEAGQSAYEIIRRDDRLVPDTFEVVSTKESPQLPLEPLPRPGYLKGLI